MIVRSKAPLRLGLAGGGTDVSPYSEVYGGYVLNATISLYAHCTIKETNNNLITISSTDLETEEIFSSNTTYFKLGTKLDLIKQVLNHLIIKNYVEKFKSFSMYTFCDAPPGTGLGSSSTIVVSVIKAFSEWLNITLGEYEIAKMAYEIERIDLNLSGGKQDQYAASFGGFNFMEFKKNKKVIVNPLRIKKKIINELEASILLLNLGTSRMSSEIIKEQKKSVNDNSSALEAMHKIKNTAFEMKDSILSGKTEKLAKILNESWMLKKRLTKSITNNNIDNAYNNAQNNGAIAGKISGAGGGGVMMLIVKPSDKYKVIKSLIKFGHINIPFVFTKEGCQSWSFK